MKKNIFGIYYSKKMEFVLSSEKNCPKSEILLMITEWGESGKVMLQVSIAVFSGAVEKIFGQRWLSSLAKLARTPMRELPLNEGIFALLMQNTNCINCIISQYWVNIISRWGMFIIVPIMVCLYCQY